MVDKYKNNANITLDNDRESSNKKNNEYVGEVAYYVEKFYDYARGHLNNKYHVAFWGEYVEEALRVMDQNSYADKYYPDTQTKQFKGVADKHSAFREWANVHYDKNSKVLNLFWAASNLTINGGQAQTGDASIDNTKPMPYPVVKGIRCDNSLSMTIVDDPYMMWWNFFNALFNVQFSPLVLKPRSVFHKMVIGVNLFHEAHNWAQSEKGISYTDAHPSQLYEFNSAVLTKAPDTRLGFKESSSATFNVNFKYPNAFQGSFKDHLRYLRDNTVDGCDSNTLIGSTYNTGWWEDDYNKLKGTSASQDATYETFQPKVYKNKFKRKYFSPNYK